jgi:hypothetical protein
MKHPDFIVQGAYNKMPWFYYARCLLYRVSTTKRPDFGDILNIRKLFQVLSVCCLLQNFRFPSKSLGYLIGHREGSPIVLTNGAHVEVYWFFKLNLVSLLWGYAACCAYYQGLLVKPSFATNVQDVFILYSLSQHVSAYLMAILRRIVQNIKGSCYFYNGFVVFSTTAISCLQLSHITVLNTTDSL